MLLPNRFLTVDQTLNYYKTAGMNAQAYQALEVLKSSQSIFIHGGAATPQVLIEALLAHAPRLENVEIMHLHTHCDPTYARPDTS